MYNPCGEPGFSHSVVALEEINGMGIGARSIGFNVVEVAAQHCDELQCILK